MRLVLFTFIIAALALVAASSAPTAEDKSTGLIIFQTRTVGEYTLTVWVDAPGASVTNSGSGRRQFDECGNNYVTCSSSNRAPASYCAVLIAELYDMTPIPYSPRAVCLGKSGMECCVSWSGDAEGLQLYNLMPAADEIFVGCYSGAIAGYADNVNLQGSCVRQCLSNRPNGCQIKVKVEGSHEG